MATGGCSYGIEGDRKISEMANRFVAGRTACVELACSPDYMQNWPAYFNSWPSMKHMGFRLRFAPPFASVIVIDPVEGIHRGGRGQEAVNGAVISGLLDGAVATTGFAHFPNNLCGTVQMSVNIMRPVFGNSMVAFGIGVKRTKSLIFCEAEVFDEEWRLCATANGIVASSDRKRDDQWAV